MYSYKTGKKNSKTAKGVKKNVRDRDIHHSDYLDVLKERGQLRHKMKTIRSKFNDISSCEMNKISLSCYDDKKYILSNGVESYAYGHIGAAPQAAGLA